MVTTTSTMFLYFEVGENYVEAVEPALSNNGGCSFFFVICSLLGLFFIASPLLQVFSDVDSSANATLTPQQYRQWAALSAMFTLFTRSALLEEQALLEAMSEEDRAATLAAMSAEHRAAALGAISALAAMTAMSAEDRTATIAACWRDSRSSSRVVTPLML